MGLCMQESLVGSKVLRYFAHVTVACVTLHMSAFCHCYLQESSTAQWSCCTRRCKCSNTVGGSNDESLTEVVPTLVSHLSLLPPGIILCSTVLLHFYPLLSVPISTSTRRTTAFCIQLHFYFMIMHVHHCSYIPMCATVALQTKPRFDQTPLPCSHLSAHSSLISMAVPV